MSVPSPAPLEVAVVGAGPAGFYVIQHLFQSGVNVRCDLFERLPAPHGLVRYGVAPDHPKIKSVTAVYDKLAADARFRFFGNVELGRGISIEDLRRCYDQIVLCTGAQTARPLGVPGEELSGSHSATDFVAWYNGHPDATGFEFDLSCSTAVVVGVGNVAIDVARILCRTPEELARTDIADHALEALSESAVRHVVLLGRRGPAQAAFTPPEAKELGELAGASVETLAEEVALDPLSREALEGTPDKSIARNLEILAGYAEHRAHDRPRRLTIRFLVSPLELWGDARGRLAGVRLAQNRIAEDARGGLRAEATGHEEQLAAGLLFRAVGYHGLPLEGLPFDARAGVIPSAAGRVLDPATGRPLERVYVAGWIKRGPTGVIGTNKPDAGETVRAMLEDRGRPSSARPEPDAILTLLAERGVHPITWADWRAIDAAEIARGVAAGRPRVKFTERREFREACHSLRG